MAERLQIIIKLKTQLSRYFICTIVKSVIRFEIIYDFEMTCRVVRVFGLFPRLKLHLSSSFPPPP